MIACSLIDLTNQISGRLIGEDRLVDVVFTDTRRHSNDIEEGASLFVALRGPNFDGNDYISDISGTVSAVVVDRECDITVPQIVVENTRLALARIAHLNRQRSKAEFIAVTGSSGKTTVKEMIAAILSNIGRSYATRGNLNNDIGVPLSILEIDSTIEYAVLELGANHQGEIAFTSHITEPKVALVNNVSEAHLQGFGDINGVARAKAEIYASLTEDGIAVVNADDSFYDFFLQQITTESLSFSVKNTADVYATNIISREEQKYSFTINYNE